MYFDLKGKRKENKNLKKSIRAFMLLDREMWKPFGVHWFQFWTQQFCLIFVTRAVKHPQQLHRLWNVIFWKLDIYIYNVPHSHSPVSYQHGTFSLNVLVIHHASGCAADIKQTQTPDISQSVQKSLNLGTRITRKKKTFLSRLTIIYAGFHRQASVLINTNEIQNWV